MGRYEDFWAVTEAALRYAIRRLGLRATRGADRATHGRLPVAGLLSRGRAALSAWLAGPARSCRTARRRCWRPPWPRAASGPLLEHVPLGRRGEGLQAGARRLRPRPRGARPAGRGHPVRLLERLGRRRGQGLRVPGRVVQPHRGPARRARHDTRLRDHPPGPTPPWNEIRRATSPRSTSTRQTARGQRAQERASADTRLD